VSVKTALLMPNAALALAELIVLGALAWLLIRIARVLVRGLGEVPTATGECLLEEGSRELLSEHITRTIKLLAGIAAIGVVAYNAWVTALGYSSADLLTQATVGNPALAPRALAITAAQIIGILVLLRLLSWLGAKLRAWIVARLKSAAVVRVADTRVDMLGCHFAHLITAALWLVGGLMIASVLDLPDTAVYWLSFVLSLAVILALVRLISDSLDAAVDAIHEGLPPPATADDRGRRQVARIVGSVKGALRWSVYIAAGAHVLRTAPLGRAAYNLSSSIIRAAGIIVLAQLVLAAGMAVIARLAAGSASDTEAVRQRRETMLPLISSLLRYVVYFVAGVMALQMLGVDVTAILAGAGIAGLAIGFGAQSLVQDIIAGFFTLFDAEYMVGDYVEVAGTEGTVEAITLRETSVRRRDGALAIIPNGEIKQVINYSKRFVRAVVDVGVSYEGDLERALAVLEQVGRDAGADIPDITGPPGLRVRDFNDSDIGLRMSVPVRPGMHWDVACELRRRVKLAFDEQSIEIPFSRHVVILQTPEGEPVRELPVRLVDDRRA